MNAYRQYVIINESKQLLLSDLPFNPGQKVEVIVIAEEITEKNHQKFLEEANQGFLRLKNEPEEWKEELAERQIWDNTLLDDLNE